MPLSGTDLLERLVAVVPSPVIVADLAGRLVLFNPAAVAALGYPAAEACGRLHVTDLYHRPEDARRALRRLREPGPAGAGNEPFDVTLRARNGTLIPVRLTVSLLHGADGHAVATLGVFEDRREHIALGMRLEDAAVQVEHVERRAAGMAAVSSAVHEMAQPLTAAMGNVEMLLLDPTHSEQSVSRLKRAYDQLERLRAILARFAKTRRAGDREAGR